METPTMSTTVPQSDISQPVTHVPTTTTQYNESGCNEQPQLIQQGQYPHTSAHNVEGQSARTQQMQPPKQLTLQPHTQLSSQPLPQSSAQPSAQLVRNQQSTQHLQSSSVQFVPCQPKPDHHAPQHQPDRQYASIQAEQYQHTPSQNEQDQGVHTGFE